MFIKIWSAAYSQS